ncbi:NAD+ diphosphatase [Altererythrobacter atlanticus]|uniref:NAD(+) diphosphatase n=1 Tax=Croceibacterium atlanticum TaxID=1267766 RepID=A0A0F7KSY4_9SPHN|nr:NAD(+) diphosphatase [Croceibacterium atlanticum]AKH42281.1 NADH pyrophosphatase [Croceibacterium atlanticum]MBB5731058.1 NAD+ diphosphatase [Croceibacterium atlanticum]
MEIAFGNQPLDRADHLRTDPDRLAQLRSGTDALLLRLDGLAPEIDAEGVLQWAPIAEAPADAELVFLGLSNGRAAFAAVPPAGDAGPAYAHRKSWDAIALMSAGDLAIYGGARSLLDWHARHRFCANCGERTHPAKGGWQRNCGNCSAQHFPRVDPVAIMLVQHEGRLLLGRQSRFPPRSYSALAGFVEPGETIEEAVARETFEEAGVRLRDIRYIASQPWPFPSQLMIGCIGHTDDPTLAIDKTEIEDARWFTRDAVAEAIARGKESASFLPPPRQAIAHYMLRWWLEQSI